MKDMPDNSIDSVVTDPPYGLKFMGKKWDYKVPSIEIWKEVLRVLKPGGHVLSFCGTRTYHRMVINMEDAGFEIRDQIMWLYGSGFPKSMNVGKKTGEAAHEGLGTALKPANEPIVVARKPLEAKLTVAANVLKYGTGALNIDAGRVASGEDHAKNCARTFKSGIWAKSGKAKNEITTEANAQGRWPANVILDEEAGQALDAQTSYLHASGNKKKGTAVKETSMFGIGEGGFGQSTDYGDSGGASRFFYCAKASKSERGLENNHPTVKPIKLMQYLIKLITPEGGVVLDPFMGSGTTGVACKSLGFQFIGCELSQEYLEIAEKRIANSKEVA